MFDEAFKRYIIVSLRFNTVLSLMSTVISVTFILRFSSTSMKLYKYYLLNIAFWSQLFDLHIALFFVPIPLFPAPVICSAGFFTSWEFNSIFILPLFSMILGGCGVSLMSALLYRYLILTNQKNLVNKKCTLVILVLAHFVFAFPAALTLFLAIREKGNFNEVQEFNSEINKFIKENICFGFVSKSPKFYLMFATASITISTAVGIFIFFLLKIFAILKRQKFKMSVRTIKAHRQMIYSLILQILIPIFVLVIPFSMIIVFYLFDLDWFHVFNQYLFQLGTTHTFFNTILMLASIKPYRSTIKSFFYRSFSKLFHQQPATAAATATSMYLSSTNLTITNQ